MTKAVFQSTQPEWAATLKQKYLYQLELISIHAARMGCDKPNGRRWRDFQDFNPRSPNGLRQDRVEADSVTTHFNPRSPNGLRLAISSLAAVVAKFQSTQPEWAATGKDNVILLDINISIHAARMGCDLYRQIIHTI